MNSKLDTYRIYKILDAVRKGFYWQNIDSVDSGKRDEYLRMHMNNIRELDDISNTNLTLTIFATSILLAILQLIESLFNSLDIRFTLPTVGIYAFSLILIFIYYSHRRKECLLSMDFLEKEVTKQLDKDLLDLKKAEIADSIQIHLTELSLLDEIGEEALANAHNRKVSDAELEHLLNLVVNKADEVKLRIDQKRKTLAQLREDYKA